MGAPPRAAVRPTSSGAARSAFERGAARPLFRCAWDRAVFLHYEADPRLLQPQVPFPLDLRDGKAYVSAVAFTLRGMRFFRGGPPFATHAFLNLRTYVRGNGIFFLAEWLTNPLCIFLGPRLYGLPYRRGRLEYRHRHETGMLRGRITTFDGTMKYRAPIDPRTRFRPSETGSLEEFLLERYVAFTRREGRSRLFRVWHPPWERVQIDSEVEGEKLLASTGPWFRAARRIGATYSPGFEEVWMGRPEEEMP